MCAALRQDVFRGARVDGSFWLDHRVIVVGGIPSDSSIITGRILVDSKLVQADT
jgi:hypothetical protein